MSRRFDRLFAPKSVAVIGGGVWCESVIRQLQKIGFAGAIFAVHPKRDTVAGIPAHPSIDALPLAPDAAFIGINRHATVEAVTALRRKGAGGAVCFASGFAEAGAEDQTATDLQTALIEAAGEMPILGPNCYGFVNALDRAALWPDQHGLRPISRGVAIITQSSNIAINLTMQRRALPIATVVTCGNQAQSDMADIAQSLLADDRITALGLHIEGIADLRAFETMASAATKPIVALKVGRSVQAQTAAVSHTASMAGSASGSDALMARLGIGQADTLSTFMDTLQILHMGGPLAAPRIGSLSCSGGEASLMADMGLGCGITFPPLTPRQSAALGAALGPMVALANPLDYHTYVWGDVPKMAAVFAAMADPANEMTVLVLDLPRADICDPAAWECAVEGVIAAQATSPHRFAVATSLPENMPEEVAARFAAAGVVPLFDLDHGLGAIATAARCTPSAAAAPLLLSAPPKSPEVINEHAAKALLADFAEVTPNTLAHDLAELTAFIAGRAGPFVVKSTGAAHKSEMGGVRLNLDAKSAAATAQDIGWPVLIEEMIEGAQAELLLSVLRDPAHGFVLTLGAGGIHTEIFRDTAHLLLPASRQEIETALASLKIAPILQGYRGKPPIAQSALLDVIMGVQRFVGEQAARIEEVEINPVICTPTAAIVADALIRMDPL